ncbi:hypothetical protein CI109_100258 [Kwoniella shandongensis]|uniref:Uncharacterized protein n=1 Tax=Kwoniella shandongensis TaxID=1734106 RepID=A0A5M6C462_9TREE|nr:uncharacterized protein CI109_001897 [Kwoniella shandongensis]KAA5529957.1 hypothetical protein CI109_001897 [Kwoniella shandongensis]
MASQRPPWVVKDLANILGLDEESVKEMVVPDLESYTHEARLRVHLQDFLGSSPQAKAFTTRYISYRFPSLATSSSSSAPPITLTPDPALDKPRPSTTARVQGKSKSTKGTGPNSGTQTPSSRLAPKTATTSTAGGGNFSPDALNAAFGPGGKVYQKNRDVDDSWGRPSSSSGFSRGGSGSNTPSHSHSQGPLPRQRQAGAISIQVQTPRIDGSSGTLTPSLGIGMGMGSRPSSGKGKGRNGGGGGPEKIWDRPKSKEVKRLEGMIEDLRKVREGEGKVDNGDKVYKCFCQARVHELSIYTPLCQSCGLTICSLHPPHLPCPSCAAPLSSPAQIARLILRLENEIEEQEGREDKLRLDRERARLERLAAEAGGGSFPTLSGGGGGGGGASNQHSQQTGAGAGGARKVLTIGGGGGKGKGKATITTTTYRPVPASASGSATPVDPYDPPPPSDLVPRLRSQPFDATKVEKELTKLLRWREEQDRPWGDMKLEKKDPVDVWKYTQMEVVVVTQEGGEAGRRRKGKFRRGEGGREVAGAA